MNWRKNRSLLSTSGLAVWSRLSRTIEPEPFIFLDSILGAVEVIISVCKTVWYGCLVEHPYHPS